MKRTYQKPVAVLVATTIQTTILAGTTQPNWVSAKKNSFDQWDDEEASEGVDADYFSVSDNNIGWKERQQSLYD